MTVNYSGSTQGIVQAILIHDYYVNEAQKELLESKSRLLFWEKKLERRISTTLRERFPNIVVSDVKVDYNNKLIEIFPIAYEKNEESHRLNFHPFSVEFIYPRTPKMGRLKWDKFEREFVEFFDSHLKEIGLI